MAEGDFGNHFAPLQPGRFRVARDLRGMTQTEVVGRMKNRISTGALSQIEAGKTQPGPETLGELALALQVPVGFFSLPWADERQSVPATFFRHLRSTPARERKRASALAVLLNDLVRLLEIHVQMPDLEIPHFKIAAGAEVSDAETAADHVREVWGLKNEPIPHVVRELERHGIPIANLEFGSRNVDAFSVSFTNRPLVVLTCDKSNYVRSRFDASHELGHLVLQFESEEDSEDAELYAHRFASAFLLPERAAQTELPKKLDQRGWAELAQLKRKWGISIAALLKRAESLRVISSTSYQSAMKYMTLRGWRSVEPGDKEMGPPEAPILLQRSIRAFEVHTTTNFDDLIAESGLPNRETRALVAASSDSRPVVEL